MRAVAEPITDPGGQPAGLAWKTAEGQASFSVLCREGSALGNCSSVAWMFAWPRLACTTIFIPMPLALLGVPYVDAVSVGANRSAAQSAAWKAL